MSHLLPKEGLTSEADQVQHNLFCLNISANENPTIINSSGLAIHLYIHLSVMSTNHLFVLVSSYQHELGHQFLLVTSRRR